MSLSVAIIDPDTNVASSAEQTFTSAGFAAHVLGDGDVVEFVRSTNPAVILLNVELQRGSGYSFCNRLKKQADLKGIPIILTSGQETPEAFAQHQRTATAADAYIHKPFSAEQLLDAVAGVLPGAFPNGRPAAGAPRAPGAAPALPSRNGQGSGEGDAARRGTPPPLAAAGQPPAAADRTGPVRRERRDSRSAGPTFDELIAQGRGDGIQSAPGTSAGPEAKMTFLRDSLRRAEQDMVRARELWNGREREVAQLGEVLELRERELERARKAREDLLAQLTSTEDKIAALRMDLELAAERADRLEREKKALGDELENLTLDLERNIATLEAKVAQLDGALSATQAARAEENENSATEIRDLAADLDRLRATLNQKESDWNEAHARAQSALAESQGRVAGLEVDLQSTRGKLVDQTKDAETLRRELGSLRADKASDDEKARVLIEDLESRIRDLSLDKDAVEAEQQRTALDLAGVRQRLESALHKNTDLEGEIADQLGKNADISNQLEMSETRATELQGDLADAQRHALEVAQEKSRVELKLTAVSSELAQTAQRLERTTADLEETKATAAAHARELDARVAELRERTQVLESELREAADNAGHLENTLRETEQRLQEKHRDYDAERVNRQKDVLKRDQRIADVEGKLRDLDAAMHEAERQAKTREAELAQQFDAERARAEELDRDLNRARAKGTELDGLLSDSREKYGELTTSYKRAEAFIAKLQDQAAAAAEQIAELARQGKEGAERAAFLEAELNAERSTHQQAVMQQGAQLDRTTQQAKEQILKLQEGVARYKAELQNTTSELTGSKEKLARLEEKSAKLEQGLSREQQDRQALADRNAVLTEEVETAQAKTEQLGDELTRLRAGLKRAQEEALAAKKASAGLEERFKQDEQTMIKRVDEAKVSAVEAQNRVRDDHERLVKERDEARAQAVEIRRKAEVLMRKYKELEAGQADRGTAEQQRVEKLATELRAEKEARAREAAQARAEKEQLEQTAQRLSTQAVQGAEAELMALRAQVKERDDRFTKAQADYAALREKAKEAMVRLKAADEKLKAGGGGVDPAVQEQLDELRAKYNEAVTRLKAQAELNKKIDAAYKELAEKHRKALVSLKEYRDQGAGDATVVLKVPGNL